MYGKQQNANQVVAQSLNKAYIYTWYVIINMLQKCIFKDYPINTYIVSHGQSTLQVLTHAIVVNGHEHGIYHNTQCNEEIHKCIHDEKFYDMRKFMPAW